MTTPTFLYTDTCGHMDPVASGGASGIGPVTSGDYGLVALIQNPAGTTTLTQPPTVSWGVTPLTNLGGVYLNNSQASGMVLVYGGYISDGTANFACASGTAFAGCSWGGVISGVNTVASLQTAAGNSNPATITLSQATGLQWNLLAGLGTWWPGPGRGGETNTVDDINFVTHVGNVTTSSGTVSVPLANANPWAIAVLNLS